MKDYDVMTSRRRYVIEISSFDLAKVFALVQSIIPPNFVAISQLLWKLGQKKFVCFLSQGLPNLRRRRQNFFIFLFPNMVMKLPYKGKK